MSIPHRLLGTVLSSLLTLPVLAAAPARAIPEEEALRKLAVVPVFVLVNDKGVPVPKVNQQDKLLVVPLYMERSRAEAERQKALQANPSGKVQVLPMPMSIASDRINAINSTLQDGLRMVGPVVPNPAAQNRPLALALGGVLMAAGLLAQLLPEPGPEPPD